MSFSGKGKAIFRKSFQNVFVLKLNLSRTLGLFVKRVFEVFPFSKMTESGAEFHDEENRESSFCVYKESWRPSLFGADDGDSLLFFRKQRGNTCSVCVS